MGISRKPKTWKCLMSPLQRANTVTLKRQRSICEGDQEVVKRSGKDESIRFVVHLCMETMQKSLCIAIFMSTRKNALSFLLLLMPSLQQNWRKGQSSSAWKQGSEGEMEGVWSRVEKWPKQCIHIGISE
jgi:hypothetical protein